MAGGLGVAGGWLHIERGGQKKRTEGRALPFHRKYYSTRCSKVHVWSIGLKRKKRKSRVLFLSSSWRYYLLQRQQKNNRGSRRFLYNTFKVTFDSLFPLLPTSSSLLVVFFSLPSDSARVLSTQVERFRDSCTCLYPNFFPNPTRWIIGWQYQTKTRNNIENTFLL